MKGRARAGLVLWITTGCAPSLGISAVDLQSIQSIQGRAIAADDAVIVVFPIATPDSSWRYFARNHSTSQIEWRFGWGPPVDGFAANVMSRATLGSQTSMPRLAEGAAILSLRPTGGGHFLQSAGQLRGGAAIIEHRLVVRITEPEVGRAFHSLRPDAVWLLVDGPSLNRTLTRAAVAHWTSP